MYLCRTMKLDLERPVQGRLNSADARGRLQQQTAIPSYFGLPKRGAAMAVARGEVLYLAALLSLTCLSAPTTAAALDQTYFVDKTSSGASLGTEADPFLSIQEAADILEPGDTAIVIGNNQSNPTVYAERIKFGSNSNTGTSEKGITIRAEPKRSVLMYGVETIGMDYLTVEGFQITVPEAVLADDWKAAFAIFIRSDGVTIRDNYIFDSVNGIHVYHTLPWPLGGIIEENHIYRCSTGITVHGNDWLVLNNDIERLVNQDGEDSDYSRAFGDGITFRGNHFHGTALAQIGSAHVDGLQTFTDNGFKLTNFLFEDNIVSAFHQGIILESKQFEGGVSNITIRNNVFDGDFVDGGGGAFAVLAKWGVTNLLVAHNLIANMEIHGVFLRFGAEGIVVNNIFYNAGSNYQADTQSSLTGLNNILNREGFPNYKDPSDIVDVDPLFIDPDNWLGPDGLPFTEDDGYKLFPQSPAIDAGANTGIDQDIFGASRPQPEDCPPDIGPVEVIPLIIGEDGCSGIAPTSTLIVPFYRDGDGTRGFISIKNTTTSDQIVTVVYSSLNSSSGLSSQTSHFILRARVGVSWRPVADSAEEGPLGRSVPNNEIVGPDGTNVSIDGSAAITGTGLAGSYRQSDDTYGSSFAHALLP